MEADGGIAGLEWGAALAILTTTGQTAVQGFWKSDKPVTSWAEFRSFRPVFVELCQGEGSPADFCTLFDIAGKRSLKLILTN